MSSSLTNIGITAAATALPAFVANTGPYRTKPAGPLPPALYALAIRAAAPPHLPLFEYIFPLSPNALRKEPAGMANTYDVAGSASIFGVQRVADVYGEAPPVFTLEGTTGVKYHSTDRFLFTGLESITILQGGISQYFGLVAAANGKNVPRLEFYDYFSSNFYQIVPVGPQGIYQSSNRPQLLNYRFRWMAIADLELPIAQAADTLLSTITSDISTGINQIGTSINSIVGTYSPFGPTT